MKLEELVQSLSALGSETRLRAIAELTDGPLHVSELARRVGISRPLLYMHLAKLEECGIVKGDLKLSKAGQTIKEYELVNFSLIINIETIDEAIHQSLTIESD